MQVIHLTVRLGDIAVIQYLSLVLKWGWSGQCPEKTRGITAIKHCAITSGENKCMTDRVRVLLKGGQKEVITSLDVVVEAKVFQSDVSITRGCGEPLRSPKLLHYPDRSFASVAARLTVVRSHRRAARSLRTSGVFSSEQSGQKCLSQKNGRRCLPTYFTIL